MKYLIVVPAFTIGGSERIQYLVAKHLIKQNMDLTIYFLTNKNLDKNHFWSDIPETYIKMSNCKRESHGLLYLSIHFLINKYAFVFSSNSHINGFICLLKIIFFRIGTKIIVRQSTDIYSRFKGFKYFYFYLLHCLYLFSYKVIFQHDSMKNKFLKKHKFLTNKSVVLLNPVEIPSEKIDSKTQNLFKIIMIGRLDLNKNHQLAINAIHKLKDKSIFLDIYGDGPLFNELSNIINNLNLTDNINIHNNFKPINSILEDNYSLLLHTSKVEGFPNVIIECMALGIPNIITTNSCDHFYKMPNITLVDNLSEIINQIRKAKNKRFNHSNKYFSYVNSFHKPKKFLNEIFNDI